MTTTNHYTGLSTRSTPNHTPARDARGAARRRLRAAATPVIEAVEDRKLMSVSLFGTTLTLTGREVADSYQVTQDATFVRVKENGITTAWLAATVASISANLKGGNDVLSLASNVNKPLVANGGMGDDTITGGAANDTISGNGGKDTLFGAGGADWLDGGVGGVAVYAENTGNDFLNGGDGNDVLHASDYGNCVLQGAAGNDTLYGWQGNDTLNGGAGDDWIAGYRGNDVINGGLGNDTCQGGGGTDKVYGDDGNDLLDGGTFGAGLYADNDGNDTVRGGGGNDTVHASDFGNNWLTGDDGDDALFGYNGNDYLNGGAGIDSMSGGAGDDTIIAIDGNTGESISGGAGTDIIWGDKQSFLFFSFTDSVSDASAFESAKSIKMVQSFANGADKTLNRDNIADPIDGTNYKNFASNPLFAPGGPSQHDVDQQALGDCWMLGQAAALALDNPFAVKSMVVDLGDGTYGVHLGNSFYRVDGDLPTWNAWSTDQMYAGLGQSNSLWVAILEKAYTHHRTGANTYASLAGGDPADALRQFHGTGVGQNYYGVGSNATTLANDIRTHWNAYQATTICTGSVGVGSPLVGGHCYSVAGITTSGGVLTSIRVRNPWGPDDTGGNPFVDLTPAQLTACQIWVTWGNT